MKHIHVYDLNMNLVAILEKAYKVGYELETNNIWTCQFTLPLNDPKRHEVTVKRFIELWDHGKRIGMFIIQPTKTVKNESDRSITYNCEHVIGTLHSEVLFGYHQFTNWTTRQVLQALINMQETVHWELGTVEFTRYFHYAWENEDSLLNGIVSVPKPFNESYLWTWDDTVYPFVLNLVKPDDEKVDIIRYGKNLKGIEKDEDPYGIVNRIYPLGYGEGVNQLTIKKVNGGTPYLEDVASIDKYGLQQKIWVDRRFENAATLKANGQALLDENKDPKTTVSVDCIDYELIDPYKLVKYWPAKIVGVYDQDTETNIDLRIMKLSKSDIYGNPYDIKFDLGNVREDINTTISDLEKKQLVNETYSQGATNIDSYTFNDNVDANYPAIIEFPFPDDMVNVNESILRIKTSNFRSYSKAVKAGGAVIQETTTSAGGGAIKSSTTSAGGGAIKSSTTSSGGGVIKNSTTAGGGATIQSSTTSSGGSSTFTSGFANPGFYLYSSTRLPLTEAAFENHYHALEVKDELNHAHTVTTPAHSHDFQIQLQNHTHAFQIDLEPHTHGFEFELEPHTHGFEFELEPHIHEMEISIPAHTHPIEYGIWEYESLPSKLTVRIDGNPVTFNGLEGEIDIIPYLRKDSEGRITRDYHTIEVIPDDLARIGLIVRNRFFVQSRIGGNY